MNDPIADGARAAAHRLAPVHGTRLEADVEAALYARDTAPAPPDQYLDPVALGALIVAAATLAWQVYRDLRKDRDTPPDPATSPGASAPKSGRPAPSTTEPSR